MANNAFYTLLTQLEVATHSTDPLNSVRSFTPEQWIASGAATLSSISTMSRTTKSGETKAISRIRSSVTDFLEAGAPGLAKLGLSYLDPEGAKGEFERTGALLNIGHYGGLLAVEGKERVGFNEKADSDRTPTTKSYKEVFPWTSDRLFAALSLSGSIASDVDFVFDFGAKKRLKVDSGSETESESDSDSDSDLDAEYETPTLANLAARLKNFNPQPTPTATDTNTNTKTNTPDNKWENMSDSTASSTESNVEFDPNTSLKLYSDREDVFSATKILLGAASESRSVATFEVGGDGSVPCSASSGAVRSNYSHSFSHLTTTIPEVSERNTASES